MPIFTRRRLQAMLDDMAQFVDLPKLNDLKGRLENKRIEQAIPAEIELSVLWALSNLGDVEVEPEWFGSGRPDAYTEHLFPGCPCAVEITAISDGRLSQEDDMRRIAARMSEAANKICKGKGKHLSFHFGEESGYTATGYLRRRKVDRDFVPTAEATKLFRTWLMQDGDRPPLQLIQGQTHVAITWHALAQHPHRNFFSSMPAEAYSLEDNPLHDALCEKARQLTSPNFAGLRCVVVADAGSRMLRNPREAMRSHGTVTGDEVIKNFLGKPGCRVDLVLVLSPYRPTPSFGFQFQALNWRASCWMRTGLNLSGEGVSKFVALLPTPRFEGYQARSLQQQAAFRQDARGWYIGTTISSGRTAVTVKISARALLDLLAGRITLEQFHHVAGLADSLERRNIFAHRLRQGDTLSSVRIESGGLDKDDDWLVFDLRHDPSAGVLKVPDPLQSNLP